MRKHAEWEAREATENASKEALGHRPMLWQSAGSTRERWRSARGRSGSTEDYIALSREARE